MYLSIKDICQCIERFKFVIVFTDEKLHSCMFPSHLCDNKTKCINVTQFCDDVKDCNDGSDEGGMCGKCAYF